MNIKNLIKKSVCILTLLVLGCIVVGTDALAASKGYSFKFNKESISIHSAAKTFIKKAGTANDETKVKSCAYNGYDRSYVYDDFILKTYSKTKTGSEYVSSIILTNSDVKTLEGIKIGSTKKEMIKKYGKNSGEFGVYTYKKGKTKLIFELDEKDKIIYIEYVGD